ncbi:hypothetical protein [Streptomyces sp. IBSBF 2950]|uniref:hypothetical protein n=1 Tax=Streptomyces sp. IBSBF 2950 TaxID=2903528 RepID=UPI002FDC6B06
MQDREEREPLPADFFQPGTSYRRGRWLFQCLAVAPRPFNQELRAVGFLYRPTEPDTVTGLDLADWEHGEWIPAPECPHCGAPADASGCHIPQHDTRCPTRDPNF